MDAPSLAAVSHFVGVFFMVAARVHHILRLFYQSLVRMADDYSLMVSIRSTSWWTSMSGEISKWNKKKVSIRLEGRGLQLFLCNS